MSEVIPRPSASRGRGSGRGGRGGFAGRGGRSRTNGDSKSDQNRPGAADDAAAAAQEDEGDFAELRKQYGDKTSVICEMFPAWSEIDVLYALQETSGDQDEAVTRIFEGTVSQWDEVSKPKKTTRPKATQATPSSTAESSVPRTARGGRNAPEAGRGGRGRAVDRGGRGGRGRSSHPPANGPRGKENQPPLSVPTEESSAYHDAKSRETVSEAKSAPATAAAAVEPPKPAAPPVKTWASMLRQSTAPKPAPAPPKEAPAPRPAEPAEPMSEPAEPESVPTDSEQHLPEQESLEPEPESHAAVEVELEAEVVADVEATPVATHAVPDVSFPPAESALELPPPQDELTKTNLEQVADDSKPHPTETAASTAADSWDPRQSPIPAPVIPLSASQQQAQRAAAAAAAATSGFVTTALKATADRSARPQGFQRRVLDQEEAVRMPGTRDLDRAAVQFGAFNLSETDDDIDGDREEPETRAQPPADSPISHPRTSLPPSQPVAVPEILPQKTTTITAPPPGMAPAPASITATTQTSAIAQASQPHVSTTQQYGRYGQAGPQDVQAAQPKPIDPFAQQAAAAAVSQPPFDNFASQAAQPQAQQPVAFSSAPTDYSAYYTANQQDRPYNFYGQHYGQQAAHGQPEPTQARPFGGYNASHTDNLSQYPQSGAGLNQPRFGANNENQNSGHSTPNPAAQSQQQAQQAQQAQQQQQQPQQQQGAPGSQPQTHGQQYPGYSHPYYNHPYYHQYYSGYGQAGFGPYGKGGMYGQPYGVSPNAPYDHSSSPGTFGPSSLHRDSPLGSGLGDYGRTASGQANTQPGLGASSFGGAHDSFSRGAHTFQSQGQAFNNQTQPGAGTSADELKPFGDAKSGSGPSPSIGGPRPGSATNTVPGGQAGSLPPPQSSQVNAVYGVYPSHLQHGLHGSGAYGMGGGAGSQHSTPHGSYGQAGFGSGYYGAGQQQQQQGQQQQRGGWGGNYH